MPMNKWTSRCARFAGKIWTVIGGAVLPQPACHVDSRVLFAGYLMYGYVLSSRSRMLKRGFHCLIRLFSSASASFLLSTRMYRLAGLGDQRSGFRIGQLSSEK